MQRRRGLVISLSVVFAIPPSIINAPEEAREGGSIEMRLWLSSVIHARELLVHTKPVIPPHTSPRCILLETKPARYEVLITPVPGSLKAQPRVAIVLHP